MRLRLNSLKATHTYCKIKHPAGGGSPVVEGCWAPIICSIHISVNYNGVLHEGEEDDYPHFT